MYRVIIADDEPKVSQLIKALIDWKLLGLDLVAIANDGIEALECIKNYRPDIVITDIRMPGYDGLELIKKANLIHPDIDFIIISGYQHFDYAHNAIKYGVKDYLLKPLNRDEINRTLAKVTEKYQERDLERVSIEKHQVEQIKKGHIHFFEQFLDQPPYGEMSLLEANDQFKTHFTEGCFQTLVLKPDVNVSQKPDEIMDMLLSKIEQIVFQKLKPECDELILIKTSDRLIIFLNFQRAQKKTIRKILYRIIEDGHLLRDLFSDLVITISMGTIINSLNFAYESYNIAMSMVYERLDRGCGNILEEQTQIDVKTNDIITLEKRRRLTNLVEILDVEGVKQWLWAIEKQLSGCSGKTLYLVSEEISKIVANELKHYVKGEEEIFERYPLYLEMQSTRNALMDHLENGLIKWLTLVTEQKQSESNKPIRDAQKYIIDHYNTNLNLESMSHMIGFSPAYFSTLFKKETGYNFLEYVTTIRIKMAKEQLAESSKSVIEVANAVGYHDLKHFTKQFKKMTGLNPSQYRKLYY